MATAGYTTVPGRFPSALRLIMSNIDYKAAYLRQKQAREVAEQLLENRSTELYDVNQSLVLAYTQLRDQKSQLIHQEKLASIGQLSAGVAHEINNPTGYVKSNLSTLQQYMTAVKQVIAGSEQLIRQHASEDAIQALDELQQQHDIAYVLEDLDDLVVESIDGVARIEDIVKSLKNFARPDQDEAVVFDVNECIENTLKLVANEIKYKAEIDMKLSPLRDIQGQPGSLSQVFLNILVNAAQAIDEQGKITISSELRNDEVIVQIEDNGCGIEEKNLPRIYDPFFTTKDIGVGTGLGLSVSHGIISKHGGRIIASSTPGEGSIFTIYLPVYQ
ncbi:Sensor protein ZraS [Thalassocella blandensis]|nr:Sensor protein ZraS [Thalassocella blandensis]